MQNPFTLTFGRSPLESVDRPVQINEIIENFTADTINQQMFIITGVRGSGKTVMMTEISHKLRENDDWVVMPAFFHASMYLPGLPAPVVTIGTFSSMTSCARSSALGLMSMMFTPNGFCVFSLQIRICSRR